MTLNTKLENKWQELSPPPRIRISVITASFNSGEKLAATYSSLAGQAVDFEYLIMDGASTDGSRQLGEKLAASDPRVRFFSEPDKGVYDALNKSIAKARGDYLYFIGAGDLLLPGSLVEIAEYLPAELNWLIYGDCVLDGNVYAGEFDRRRIAGGNICHQSIFYGKKVFELCGRYDLRYRAWADWDFNMRCFGKRRIFHRYVPVTLAIYEMGGLSTPGDRVFDRDHLKLIRKNLGWRIYWSFTYRPRYLLVRRRIGKVLRFLKLRKPLA